MLLAHLYLLSATDVSAEPLPWLRLAGVPLLILVSGIFVAAEYAIISVRTTRIEELIGQGVGIARRLALLKKDVTGSLATIQICITGMNLLIGGMAQTTISAFIVAALSPLQIVLSAKVVAPLATAVGFMIATLFTVVLSELVPKALTLKHTETVVLWITEPLAIARWLCTPLVKISNLLANSTTRLLGLGRIDVEEQVHTEAELEMLVDRADDAGEFEQAHGELVRRVFDFADLQVKHVMIPMAKAGVLNSDMTAEELAHQMSELPYTRWPLRDPQSGRINGIVNIKFVLSAIALAAGDAVIMHDLAVSPTYIAPDMPLVDALQELRRFRRHLAVVRGPEGEELGIVTLEDILAALVGAIPSEVQPSALKDRRILTMWQRK